MFLKSNSLRLFVSVLGAGGILVGLTNCGGTSGEGTPVSIEEPIIGAATNPQIVPQEAWFGPSCIGSSHPASPLNILSNVQAVVPGWSATFYTASGLPDPAVGCNKNLLINFSCSNFLASFGYHAPEANNTKTLMDCTNTGTPDLGFISVTSAIYGIPGHIISVLNGRNGVGTHCNGFGACRYFMEYKFFGDPSPGSTKSLTISYTCIKFGSVQIARTSPPVPISGEANHREFDLSCNTNEGDLR